MLGKDVSRVHSDISDEKILEAARVVPGQRRRV